MRISRHGGSVTLGNTAGGACVNGSLRAQGHSLTINNSSADKPALTSDRDHILATDTLTLRNNSGPAAQGGLCINVYSGKSEQNRTLQYFRLPRRMGNLWSAAVSTRRAAGSALPIPGQAESKNRTVGPVLAGSLTLEDGTGLNVDRKLGIASSQLCRAPWFRATSSSPTAGSIGRRRTPFESRGATARPRLSTAISRSGTASCTSTRRKARASGGETPSVQNCVLSLQNSHFTVRGSGSWKDIQFDEDYRWYAGDDTPNVPFYKDGREEPLRAEALTKAAYADIYTGDKVGDAMVHDASFTESKTIDGFASWPMSFDVTVQMTGDTLDLQKVDGYKELTVQGEDGKPATLYGVDSSVDLTAYFQIKNTAGAMDWKITAVDYLEQGATELRLRISGTPCSGL